MNTLLRARLLISLVAGLGLYLLYSLMIVGSNDPNRVRRAAPDVAFPLSSGAGPVRLSDLRGKVVLIDFWATWCGPCRQSIPELVQLYGKYRNQGLEIIGVSTDNKETQSVIPQAKKALGINYPIVLMEEVPGIEDKFNFEALPTLFIIDKKGMIRQKIAGYDPSDPLEGRIAALLAE